MNKFKEFLDRHHVTVLDTQKRWSRYNHTYNYFTAADDFNMIQPMVSFETEPLYTVQIPESQLKKIQEFEDEVFNNMRDYGHFNMFQILMEQKEQEKKLREEFPAVQKAYENYSLILTLCKK
jgi:hypothetical protein